MRPQLSRLTPVKLLLLALICLPVFACSSVDRQAALQRGPLQLPERVCLPLPADNPFPEPGDCGLNALWKVLHLLDPAWTAGALEPFRNPAGAAGTTDFELAAMARRAGFNAQFGALERERLDALLRQGTPVILLIQRDLEYLLGRGHHWVVVYGYDRDEDEYRVDWGQEDLDEFVEADELIKNWTRTGQRAVVVQNTGVNEDQGERP